MFALPPQGFHPNENSGLIDLSDPDPDSSTRIEYGQLSFLDFEGRHFTRGCCYQWSGQGKKNACFVLGIKSLKSKSKAVCARIEHASQTFLGQGDSAEVCRHYEVAFRWLYVCAA
jgi:hypothetical protein